MAGEICDDKSRNNIASSSTGFCYSDVSSGNSAMQTHLGNQIQGFETNPSEIFNLTTNMEMTEFFKQNGSSNNNNNNTAGSFSSRQVNESTTEFYQQHEFNKPPEFTTEDHLIVETESAPWDDSSLRCVFPCEGNERPSQGLSLSLSSTNPTSIGLQSFELRQTSHGYGHNQHDDHMRQTSHGHDHDHNQHEDHMRHTSHGYDHNQHDDHMRLINSSSSSSRDNFHNHLQGQFQLRDSKYLGPAKELLNEFCSLGTKQIDISKQKNPTHKTNQQWDDENGARSSSMKQSPNSLHFMELQKRKTKLLSMLEEVDIRYKHYCDQMRAVLSSFEAVAGSGAASVYSALASKAMSRHFRCLRDAIVSQIQATRKAMGEKDPVAPGTTRGETPRLRILDQTLRQQRAFNQMNMMESHPWRPQRGLPERSVSVLRAWLFEHFLHPYPSDVDKHILSRQTGLSRSQVSNWFINARVRLWKPMVEEMYVEETKEHENNMASPNGATDGQNDKKPTLDSECLSSIITNPDDKNEAKSAKTLENQQSFHHQQESFGTYGAMELDFSSYTHQTAAGGGVSYGSDHHQNGNSNNNNQGFNGGGVSLTLGLQQHGGNGVSLAFNTASQGSLFYPRDQIGDCQPAQYSLLDGDQGQHLPYRNLMGAQLLHDLAG